MKKLLRPLAILLVLVLMLSMTAFATGDNPEVIKAVSGLGHTWKADYSSLKITYEVGAENAGKTYLCWLLTMDADGDIEVPTETTVGDRVLDIKDAVADANGVVTFENVIPKTDTMVSCAIAISGMNGVELFKAGEIKVPYIPGDVDMSGTVDVGDATMLLRYLAGLVDDLSTINLKAADTDGSGSVDVGDGTTLLRTLAGLPTE